VQAEANSVRGARGGNDGDEAAGAPGREQPLKQRLREWYERLGYSMERRAPFGDADLAAPAEFLVFERTHSG
jgi:hypothetical protein